MLMLALRLILRDKGGKQHCLPFVGSNLRVEIFLKKREHQKRMRWNRGLMHLCILCIYWDFKKILCKKCLLFNCFLVIKGILKALFTSIPWLLDFSDLPNYGSNSIEEKIYTKAIIEISREDHTLPFGGKLFDSLFDSLRWAPFSLALHLYSS